MIEVILLLCVYIKCRFIKSCLLNFTWVLEIFRFLVLILDLGDGDRSIMVVNVFKSMELFVEKPVWQHIKSLHFTSCVSIVLTI